jgi:hypothetical protein
MLGTYAHRFDWSIRTLGIILRMLWLATNLSFLLLLFGCATLNVAPRWDHSVLGICVETPYIPGILLVTLSVLANRMFLSL